VVAIIICRQIFMNSAIAAVIEFFKTQSWDYKEDGQRPVVYTAANAENGPLRCFVSAGNDNEHLVFISFFPALAPPKKRRACAEVITRINYDLLQGCFEMDFEDGEIRFRTSIAVLDSDMPIPAKQIEQLVFTNLATMDRYMAPIMRVLYNNERPDEALREGHDFLPPPSPRFPLN